MTSIFLSYARDDDEPFVRRLYEDLTANGFAVWYDRTNMPSRALTFHKEICDAIDNSDRLIVIIGPKAIQSDYVRSEWQHALNACKIVIPVIRFGKRDLLPIELRKLNCPDMRETRPYVDALADLFRVLGDPVVPLGELRGVPSLPTKFLPRPEFIEHLKNTVLADVNHPVVITSAKQTTALQGMGGVGKSVIAAAFARACETLRAFRDGVVWLTLGQQPDIARNLMALGQAFNDDLKEYIDIESGKARIAKVLTDKNCLLVLDDLWDVKHAEAFVNALGTRCRLLITTRDGGLATSLGAQEHRLDVLSIEDAMHLLASYSGQPVNEMPAEAHDVAKECGNLPFALALCGAMVSEGTPWNDLLESLRQADLTFLMKQFPNYPYPDVLKSLKVSVDALAHTDPTWEKHYKELAVFPHSEAVPEETVIMFWISTNGVNERSARQLLITLERKSLIKLEGKSPDRRVSMHDLQHDYLCTVLGDLTGLHRELLEVYRQKSPEGWHTGPKDGYFFQRLMYHLVQAGNKDEVSALLFDFYWILAKLDATGVIELIADYDTTQMFLPSYVKGKNRALRLVQGALRLSAHVLAQDKTQLPSQMTGRLLKIEYPEIKALLEQMRQWKDDMWLRPLTASLTPPGGTLIRTLKQVRGSVSGLLVTQDGRYIISNSSSNDYILVQVWDMDTGALIRTLKWFIDSIDSVSVTPDGRRAISSPNYHNGVDIWEIWDMETQALIRTLRGDTEEYMISITPDSRCVILGSSDKTLKVWDIENGEIRKLKGHTGGVKAVSITPSGKRAISVSSDKTLKVWDMETGEEICTLDGHTSRVNAVSVTPDGRRAISASDDNTLKAWDMETGEEICMLKGHTDGVKAVSITPSGKRAISVSSDNTLKVWNLDTGEEICTLLKEFSYFGVTAVCVTPDGSRAISASSDNTLKVWNLEIRTDIRMFQGHSESVTAVSVTPDGRRAISGSNDKTLKVWDMETGEEIRTFQGHSESVTAVSVTPDGRRAISGSYDKTLKVWDIETGEEICTLGEHTDGVDAVSITPNGKHAISASSDKMLKVWDMETGEEICMLLKKPSGFGVTAVCVTPDSRRAIFVSDDYTLNVLEIDTGAVIRTLLKESSYLGVTAVCVTPDGSRAISASSDNTLKIKLWDIETGKMILSLNWNDILITLCFASSDNTLKRSLKRWDRETGARVDTIPGEHVATVVCVTPDGKHLISASNESLIVWDIETRVPIHVLMGHVNVTYITVTLDGKRIIFGSTDMALKIWDIESGKTLASFSGESRLITSAISQDGKTIVVGEESGRVHFLRMENYVESPPIVTAWNLNKKMLPAFGCPLCRTFSEIPASVLGTEIPCPHCGKPIKLNSFTINADWRQVAKAWQRGK